MNLQGQTLSFPFRGDNRGTLTSIASRDEIIAEAIVDIVETRQGERVMLPDYGMPDFIFSVMDFSFGARFAHHLEEQVLKYVPLVKSIVATSEIDDDGRAVVNVSYTAVGQVLAPKNLVFPVWQYVGGEA